MRDDSCFADFVNCVEVFGTPTNAHTDASPQRLRQAIVALASVCDGAQSEDGRGFSRDDARAGHEIAAKVRHGEPWTVDDVKLARQLATTYRRQLEGMGFEDIERESGKLTEEEQAALKPFDFYTVGDPSKEPSAEPPPPIVEGLLYPGFVLIAGPPKKSFKTLWATYLALAVQGGLPFFGRPSRRQRVLIVQRDMGSPWFVRYVRALRYGMGLPAVPAIPVVSAPMDLQIAPDIHRLRLTIQEHQAELLIIDSARSTSSVEENYSEEVRKITRNLCCDLLRDELGLTVVLIAHVSKQGAGPRGSTEWVAAADSVLGFEPKPEAGYVAVNGEGRHPGLEFFFAFEEVPGSGGFGLGLRLKEVSRVDVVEARKREAHGKLRALASSLWEATAPITKTDLVTAAKEGHSLRAQGTRINELLDELKHHFTSIDEETRGRTRKFSITDRDRFREEFKRQFGEEPPVVPAGGNDGP